jgi:hypothetical protein
MRYLLLTPLLLLFFSCGNEEINDEYPADKTNLNDVLTDIPDSLYPEMVDTLENEFFLDNLPSKWIMLTDDTGTGEPLVIYNWCEAETPFIEFEAQKGDEWKLFLAYGQDGEICEINFFEAFEEEQELMQVVSGTFRFMAEYDESTRFVDFWWNKDTKIGHFDGIGMQSVWFVPEEDKDNYESIDEDCEGLWDEEEVEL